MNSDPSFTGVRIATKSDEPSIYELLVRMHGDDGIFSFSENKVKTSIRYATRPSSDPKDPRGVIGVIDGPKGLEATIGLSVNAAWYSDDWHISEVWSFVHPDYRNGGHTSKLIAFAQWCALKMELPLAATIINNKRTEARVRIYKRLMPYTGAFFMWGAKNGPDARAFIDKRV